MRCPQSCALALSAFLVGQIVQGAEPPADLVVLNGKIVTVNPHSSIVEAAAVREGRFVAVGANSKVKKLVGDRTRVIDAHGKTVVPGLIETHMHGIDPNKSLNPFNPFLAMYVAVTRRTESGRVIGLEQRVSREQALRMATIDAAYLSFDEKRKGSIEVGKLGDLVLLSDDLLTCDAERIKDIQPLATVVGGKVVHDALSR